VRLLAENRIINIGRGALELRARHSGVGRFAPAVQIVRSASGAVLRFPGAGFVYWKAIPGQGHYWKFWRAARFELWTLRADGTRDRLLRTGPKLSYCFRDLKRVRDFRRTPRRRVFGACSQSARPGGLRLGTSAGWADIYPWRYHENWISVTGLRGCFAFVHRADPLDSLIEEREDDNLGIRHIRLPARKDGSVRSC
jgi:hypothetical protein